MKKQYSIDFALLLTVICLFVISLLAVYSGSGQYETQDMLYFVKRQIFWYIVGFALMAAVAYFDYELLERLSFRFFAGGIFLIILVHFSERVKMVPKGGSASVQSKFSHQSS